MIESPIPQDILKYKAKFIGNFSAREAISIGSGFLLGALGQFVIFRPIEADNIRLFCSFFFLSLPAFSIGFVRPYGQPLEKIGWIMLKDNLIHPAKRIKEIHYDNYEKWRKEGEKEETEGKEKKKSKKIQPSEKWIGVK